MTGSGAPTVPRPVQVEGPTPPLAVGSRWGRSCRPPLAGSKGSSRLRRRSCRTLPQASARPCGTLHKPSTKVWRLRPQEGVGRGSGRAGAGAGQLGGFGGPTIRLRRLSRGQSLPVPSPRELNPRRLIAATPSVFAFLAHSSFRDMRPSSLFLDNHMKAVQTCSGGGGLGESFPSGGSHQSVDTPARPRPRRGGWLQRDARIRGSRGTFPVRPPPRVGAGRRDATVGFNARLLPARWAPASTARHWNHAELNPGHSGPGTGIAFISWSGRHSSRSDRSCTARC
jgi:hypothetical protein